MTTTTTHQPGDFFVVRTTGIFARAICVACNSTVNHAGVYVGDGLIVEAEPGKRGARYNRVENYADALWSTHNLPEHLTPTAAELAQIATEAIGCLGTPYGLWDIVAIAFTQRALGRLINPAKPYARQPWWVRRIIDRLASTHELICSQLVDLCYSRAAVHLFDDGRWEGFVSPEDLRALLIEGITEAKRASDMTRGPLGQHIREEL
jgi:hypothetical protein